MKSKKCLYVITVSLLMMQTCMDAQVLSGDQVNKSQAADDSAAVLEEKETELRRLRAGLMHQELEAIYGGGAMDAASVMTRQAAFQRNNFGAVVEVARLEAELTKAAPPNDGLEPALEALEIAVREAPEGVSGLEDQAAKTAYLNQSRALLELEAAANREGGK